MAAQEEHSIQGTAIPENERFGENIEIPTQINIHSAPNYTDINYLTLIRTPVDILNKRLESYKGCNVVNLSKLVIPDELLHVLSHGLSFCPTPKNSNTPLVFENLEKFIRKIKLRTHFGRSLNNSSVNEDTTLETEEVEHSSEKLDKCFKFPNNWIPEIKDATVNLYTTVVRKNLLNWKPQKKRQPQNISPSDLQSITNLAKNPHVVIKKADKGKVLHCSNGHHRLPI